MARFKTPMAFGNIKEDITSVAYTTGDATADVELNVDTAVVKTKGDLILMLEHLTNAIRDDKDGYPPA